VCSAGQTVPSTAQIRAKGNNTKYVGKKRFNKGNKKITELRTILQRESKNS
jgi:hypothetical protein